MRKAWVGFQHAVIRAPAGGFSIFQQRGDPQDLLAFP
jgi:hypothetical protein